MQIEDEFFSLIKASFSESEINEVRGICNKIISGKLEKEKEAWYYSACGLFYNSMKDFENFKLNLAKHLLPLHYTEYILLQKIREEGRNQKVYGEVLTKAGVFLKELVPDNSIDRVSNAIANAIVPILVNQYHIEDDISYYKGVIEFNKIHKALESNGKLSRVAFDIDCKQIAVITNNKICNELWDDMMTFISYHRGVPSDVDCKLDELEEEQKLSTKKITNRICMILVYYGVLSETYNSDRYILVNQSGEYVRLNDDIMYRVYKFMKDISVKFSSRSSEVIDENCKEYCIEKIQNQLRKSKGFRDRFTYNDISTGFWACFGFCRYSSPK